jgi:hypothetical protein
MRKKMLKNPFDEELEMLKKFNPYPKRTRKLKKQPKVKVMLI